VALRAEPLEDRLLPSLAPKLLLDINPGGASSNPARFTQVNNLVFFRADDGIHGTELWASDGTAAGTYLVKDINPGASSSYPRYLTNVNGTLFFQADDGGPRVPRVDLWESNGTAAGTFLVKEINPFTTGSYPTNLTSVNGTLFFSARDPSHGRELWESNGTAAGTFLVQDINPGVRGSYPSNLTNVNGALFFQANDFAHGIELWESNGTAAGTFLVQDINPGASDSNPRFLTNVNGTLFFQADDGTHGAELWASNGTAAGTFLVQDIEPGTGGSTPTYLLNVNGTLFFIANDGTHGLELWASNGTAAGTFLVQDINPGSGDSYPGSLTNVNGTLFFGANDGTRGFELWASNGTAAGTFLVQDINPGANGSNPNSLANVNGTLFFSAKDGTQGVELWASNGTAAGTFLVADVNPGPRSSYPNGLTNVNGALFFSANDGSHGFEPWILPVSTLTATTVTSSPNPTGFGQAVTFTATVSAQALGSSPTGTVDFRQGTTDLTPGGVTLTGGEATFTTATLAVGSHTITAIYSGDSNLSGSQADDSASPQVVNIDTTSTTVLSYPATVVSGQAMAFVAVVSNTSGPFGAPTGRVQFAVDGTNVGFGVTLINGVASISTRLTASASPHTVTATYTNSDGNFMGGSGSATQAVAKDGTGTLLASSPNPSVVGQTVSFTATVSALVPGGGTPTGTVDFKEGATDLTPGGVTLAGGQAIFVTSSLSVGHHTVAATYSGDGNFMGSSGADSTAPQVVNRASTRTVLLAFPNLSVFGQVVTFTVGMGALAPGKGTPTGTVTLTDGTTTIGSLLLSGGRGTFTTASLSRDNHLINANYGGDGNFLASAYTNYGAQVQKDATTTKVTPSVNPAVVGHTITFTAQVQANSPGAGTATGTVTFKDITTVLGTGTLNGAGRATFTTSQLALGTHAITATYAGDNNFTSSVSVILAETVKAGLQAASQQAALHFSATSPALVATSSPQTAESRSPAGSVSLLTSSVASHVDDYFVTIIENRRRGQPADDFAVESAALDQGLDWNALTGDPVHRRR
jgi:ELWxxDGT repeat protein